MRGRRWPDHESPVTGIDTEQSCLILKEAIAIRLEAITTRLEAIPFLVGLLPTHPRPEPYFSPCGCQQNSENLEDITL